MASVSLILVFASARGQMATIVEHSFDGTGLGLDGVDVIAEGGTFDGNVINQTGHLDMFHFPGMVAADSLILASGTALFALLILLGTWVVRPRRAYGAVTA